MSLKVLTRDDAVAQIEIGAHYLCVCYFPGMRPCFHGHRYRTYLGHYCAPKWPSSEAKASFSSVNQILKYTPRLLIVLDGDHDGGGRQIDQTMYKYKYKGFYSLKRKE